MMKGKERPIKVAELVQSTSAGEESLLNLEWFDGIREETVVAKGDTYLLEIEATAFWQVKLHLIRAGKQMDWFTLLNFFKNQILKKKGWRLYYESQMAMQ